MHSYLRALKTLVILLVLTFSILSAPSISSVVLNSSDLRNRTDVNLTAWPIGLSGTNVSVIWDWRMANITYDPNPTLRSLAAVILPFEVNISSTSAGAVRDYSIFGNNATLGGGVAANAPTWKYDSVMGGVYDFDGINDYMNISFAPNVTPGTADDFTYEIWLYVRNYTNETGNDDGTFFFDSRTPGGLLDMSRFGLKARLGNFSIQFCETHFCDVAVSRRSIGPILLNQWQHIVIVRNYNAPNSGSPYSNRVFQNGTLKIAATQEGSDLDLGIVKLGIFDDLNTATAFNGSIGEFRIYNKAIADRDIATFYNNSMPKYDTISSYNITRKSTGGTQKWQACAIPVNATEEGVTVCSNNLTVILPDRIYDTSRIPILSLPDQSIASNFTKAFQTLDMLVGKYQGIASDSTVNRSFTYPASNYSLGWWEWDQSMHMKALKWVNSVFSQDIVRNFIQNQAAYGTGCITWTSTVTSSCSRSTVNFTAFPAYLTSAYEVARMSDNITFVNDTYFSMVSYYNFLNRTRNASNGLTTCTAEESILTQRFAIGLSTPNQNYICVDLNAYLAKGAENIAKLAQRLGETSNYTKYMNELANRQTLINQYLWNSSNNRYQHINLSSSTSLDAFNAENFYPLLSNISNSSQRAQLLSDLQDNSKFNWTGGFLLYSMARTDPLFVIDRNETYQSAGFAWRGDIWAPINYDVLKGLEDTGRQDLAAHLAYNTVVLFGNTSRNFPEYFTADGNGVGSANDGWTSAVYATVLIEDIFGVTYDAADNRITVFPRIPSAWDGSSLQISNLTIPTTNDRLTVNISSFSSNQRAINVSVYYPNGTLSENHYNLTLYLPLPFDRTTNKVFKSGIEITTANFSYFNYDDDSDVEAVVINTTLSEISYMIEAVPIATSNSGGLVQRSTGTGQMGHAQDIPNQTVPNQTTPERIIEPAPPVVPEQPSTPPEVAQSSAIDYIALIVVVAILAAAVIEIRRLKKPPVEPVTSLSQEQH